MRILGLVGGIGSGKSTVAALLAELGAEVIDADRITGECLMEPAIRRQIEEKFGKDVFGKNGRLDRQALADIVFASAPAREALHRIIHPRIRERMRSELDAIRDRRPEGLVVIDAPLLLESEFRNVCDEIVMVRTPGSSRLERTAARGWSDDDLKRRESFQTSLEEKERASDRIIDNAGSMEDLKSKITALFEEMKST